MNDTTTNRKELVLWHEFDGPGDTSIEVLEEICRLYSERNGIQVTPEVMGIQALGKRLGEIHKGGVSPHMAFVPSDMVTYSEIGRYSKVPDGLYEDVLSESALATMKVGGEQYGVPALRGNHLVLYLNKEIYPDAPASWADIEAAAPGLRERGIAPIGGDLNQSYWFIPFFSAFGGWPMRDGRLTLEEPAMKQALTFVKEQMALGTLVSEDGSNGLIEGFIDGKIGAIICGEWIYNHLDINMGDKLGVARLPQLEAGQPIAMSSAIGLIYPGRSLESELRDDILAFTSFMLSEECQLLWANKVQRIPADEAVVRRLAAASTPNKAEILSQLAFSRPMPIHPSMIYSWIAMQDGLQLLPTHNVDDVYRTMEAKLEQALRDAEAATING